MKLFVVLFLVATSLTAVVQSQDSAFIKSGGDAILETCKKAFSNNEPLPTEVRTLCENLLGNNATTTAAPTTTTTTLAPEIVSFLEKCKAEVAKRGLSINGGLSCEALAGLTPSKASPPTGAPVVSNLEELLKPSKIKVSLGGKLSAGK